MTGDHKQRLPEVGAKPDAATEALRAKMMSEDKYKALEQANELERYATSEIEKQVAHAVRDLIAENIRLKKDLHHYMMAANAEAELVDELRKENEALRSAIRKLHAAKGRYHTQLAACDLFDMVGLPNERPKT